MYPYAQLGFQALMMQRPVTAPGEARPLRQVTACACGCQVDEGIFKQTQLQVELDVSSGGSTIDALE